MRSTAYTDIHASEEPMLLSNTGAASKEIRNAKPTKKEIKQSEREKRQQNKPSASSARWNASISS